ncbi:zinc finger MYM-type protein 2 [Elysia marginata]|uniref:Zinc finger MYM-type protein 2 n=1 Tax=Elysia marginata TaxID=1093978 RepID=A0AAV4EV78_9GAST|nr:zinc finger MYM-type protein 2 [Elysia marginata]
MEVEDVIISRLTEKSEQKIDLDLVDVENNKQTAELLQPTKPETEAPASDDVTDGSKPRSNSVDRHASRSRSRSRSKDRDNEDRARSRSRSRSRSPRLSSENVGTGRSNLDASPDNAESEIKRQNIVGTSAPPSPSTSITHLPFFSSGPVFPARHTRDLQLTQLAEPNGKLEEKQDHSQNDKNNKIESFTNGLPSFLNHDHVERKSSNNESIDDHSNDEVSKSSDFLNSSPDNHNKPLAVKETSAGKGELESESLAPLSASFFNCQYQTPSWIDDPLIGVPASAMENKNTHRKTGADMRILTAYMRSLNEMRLPEAIPPAELDKYLSSFFLVVRKADGSEYEPCSLRAMLASIERYLRFKNYPLSLTRDSAFSNMRNVLKLKQQTLRSIGKGQKTASEVSPSSLAREGKIAHLFKTQEMGPYTPSSVVFTLCFYFCMYLKLRKSTENKKLLWGDISLLKDESGREFLTFSSQMLRRNQGSSKVNFRQRNYRVWADPSSPEKDPVTIYKFYAQKRPASTNTNFSPFYLGVNVLYPTQGQPWYRPAAMGINKLNEMVRQIRDITGVRTMSDFQGSELQSKDKPVLEIPLKEHTNGNGHESVKNIIERQDLENPTIKMEVIEGEDDEDSCSNLAIDFSQEAQESPMEVPSSNDVMSSLSMQHTSEGDNSNDSFPQYLPQGLITHMNGGIGHQDVRSGHLGQDEDLDLATNGSSPPDSPLNCSTKDRIVETQMEDMQQVSSPGQMMLKENEPSVDTPPLSVKATSSCSASGANIVLNISLTQKALQGDCPITVTAQASPSSSQHRDSPIDGHNSSAKPALFQGKLASPHSSAVSSPKTSLSSSSQRQNVSPLDAPLDLATSPLSRNGKFSSSQAKSNAWSGSGGSTHPSNGRPLLTSLFSNNTAKSSGSNSSTPSGSAMTGLDSSSPLAKRLRLSAEQAEAYTSASILASLSSASMASERLRLHLMQGLSAGTAPSYSLDPHTAAGLLDLAASSEVMRTQLLQHYGMKTEPK